MTRVFTDNHHVAVTANDLALIANGLDAWVYLHALIFLLVAVNNSAASQVVCRQFNNHSVSGENSNVVLSHFS